MGTFTPQLLLSDPTPLDPAVKNAWATILNTNFTLIDSATSGILSLSVAGNTNVTLTSANGAADQARNQHFVFSGILTGSISIFWPVGRNRFFSVKNSTTGAFSLTLDITGSPGTNIVIPQSQTAQFYSDGTNVVSRQNAVVGPLTLGSTLTMNAAAMNEAFATIVAASTTNIGAAAANYLQVTGTTTINAFDTVQAGTRRILEFAGILTLTYNATTLILPGAASVTTAAGDVAVMQSEGSGNWRCASYTRADGNPLVVNGGTF